MALKGNDAFNNSTSIKLIGGFWVWLILIIDGDNNRDLLDVVIDAVGKM